MAGLYNIVRLLLLILLLLLLSTRMVKLTRPFFIFCYHIIQINNSKRNNIYLRKRKETIKKEKDKP